MFQKVKNLLAVPLSAVAWVREMMAELKKTFAQPNKLMVSFIVAQTQFMTLILNANLLKQSQQINVEDVVKDFVVELVSEVRSAQPVLLLEWGAQTQHQGSSLVRICKIVTYFSNAMLIIFSRLLVLFFLF